MTSTEYVEARCARCGNTYQRLPTARSGLCCSCRKTKRSARKLVLKPGTEANAFTTQAQLDEWHDRDKLTCHICGGEYAGLYKHITRAHGIDAVEYRTRFAIPATYGLSGRLTREKHAACGAATAEKMAATGFTNLANGRANKTSTRMSWTPYQARDHVAAMIEAEGHPSNLEGEIDVTCTVCGNDFPVSAKIAAAYQCRAKCPACSSPHARYLRAQRRG